MLVAATDGAMQYFIQMEILVNGNSISFSRGKYCSLFYFFFLVYKGGGVLEEWLEVLCGGSSCD